MNLAVAQFGVVHEVLLRTLASRLRHTSYRLALFLAILYLLQHDLRYLRVLVQVVVQLLFDEVIDELVHAHATRRTHVFRTEFDFRLALEDRLLHIDSYRPDNTVADVR